MTSPQIVLITGANQGLGYFAALQLSKLPGYHVLVGSRDAAKGANAVKQIEAEGGPSPVSAITVDLASDPSIDAARAEIESRFGRLDVLVNNAAICIDHDFSERVGRTVPVLSTRKLLATTYDTNVFGTASLITALMPLLERSSAFRIVNVTSGLGSLSMMVDHTKPYASAQILGYNTSKSALNALTVYFAATLRAKHPEAVVVAVTPGYCSTNLNNFGGTETPQSGAESIVRVIIAEKGKEVNTGEFHGPHGETMPW